MIIKKLEIKNYGKFNNYDINFKDGFNIIWGENEAGKSTIQSFIKAMLYGLNMRTHNIRENDRKKYFPWDGQVPSGQMEIVDNKNNNYLIKREFGNSKSKDKLEVLNNITGEKVEEASYQEPGRYFIGLGEEAFERSFYIKQIESKIENSKEDELISKLTNLQESGDENISYNNAINKLDKAIKKCKKQKNQKKSGKLDELEDRLIELRQEKDRLETLYDENINDHLKLKDLIENRQKLEEKNVSLEIEKDLAKKNVIYEKYLKIKEQENEIEKMKKNLEEVNNELEFDNVFVDSDYLENIKQLHKDYLTNKELCEEIVSDKKKIEGETQKLFQDKLINFKGFNELEDDIEIKLNNASIKIDELKKDLSRIESEQKKIEALSNELESKEKEIEPLTQMEELNEELKSIINKKEKELRNFESQKIPDGRLDNLNLRKEIITDKYKSFNTLVLLGVVLFAAMIITALLVNPYFFFLAASSLILSIYGYSQRKKVKKQLIAINKEVFNTENNSSIEELNSIKLELNKIYNRFGVEDYNQLIIKKTDYDKQKNSIKHLESSIIAKKEEMKIYDQNTIIKELNANKNFLENILNKTDSNNIEDFFNNYKIFKKYETDRKNLLNDLERLKERQAKQEKKFDEIKDSLIKNLAKLDIYNIEELEEEYKKLKDFVEIKKKLVTSIENSKKNLMISLDGENIGDIELQIKDFEPDKDIKELDIIEEDIKRNNDEIRQIEKQISNTEHSIDIRFYNKRSILEVEEEIDKTNNLINETKDYYNSLTIASTILKESFDEMQNSFGPKLNKEVGIVLNKITNKKYKEVKINVDYNMRLKEPNKNEIIDAQYLSNGTWDQIYFSLRIGLINMIFNKMKSAPLVLDDSFVQYDEKRLESVLYYLTEYAKQNQVILFTCHNREVKILGNKENKSDIHIINLIT